MKICASNSEVCTHCPSPVRSRAKRARTMPLASRMPAEVSLIAMQILEIGTVAAAARRVGVLARRLDLDHIGAPIGELAHRGRAGAVGGQVNDGKAIERQGGRGHRSISRLRKRCPMLAADPPPRHRGGDIAGPWLGALAGAGLWWRTPPLREDSPMPRHFGVLIPSSNTTGEIEYSRLL